MRRLLVAALLLLSSTALSGCLSSGPAVPTPPPAGEPQGTPTHSVEDQPPAAPGLPDEEPQQESTAATDQDDEAAVRALVEEFGHRLRSVSLGAPASVVSESMQQHYGELVAPDLLSTWSMNPPDAPGRLTSSPWPDRIEIRQVTRLEEGAYQVDGEIIEVTSGGKDGRLAARRPITLVVQRRDDRWLITSARLGLYSEGKTIEYDNTDYGSRFTLPASWQGFAIVTDQWDGRAVPPSQGKAAESGPLLSIRHPAWTAENPRQDIPIMVFTLSQWEALQQGAFHVSAGPVGPNELGRNTRYVFALPVRYNYAFRAGYQEVEEILRGHPLQPVDPESAGV